MFSSYPMSVRVLGAKAHLMSRSEGATYACAMIDLRNYLGQEALRIALGEPVRQWGF